MVNEMQSNENKRDGDNIILIYMVICVHTNTNIILKCANKII